jgi:HSP20 family protein
MEPPQPLTVCRTQPVVPGHPKRRTEARRLRRARCRSRITIAPVARLQIERREDLHDAELVRRFLSFFDDQGGASPGECAPPIDVLERADRVEITADLPGVAPSSLRVVFASSTVIIAGRKAPRLCERSVAFHLAERTFGRFARAIALTGAVDVGRATASLSAGELRIVLPRIEERRGRDIPIEVTVG